MIVNGHNIILIILITFFVSLASVPIVKKISIHTNALDYPNYRKIHKKPMPRMGGLAIYSGFLFGYIIYAEMNLQMLSILISSFLIILLGLFDDIKPIKAKYKLIVQIIAALIVVFYGSLTINFVNLFDTRIDFIEPINYVITILFIVGITNAINLIDGLDGLASGVSAIYFATVAVLALIVDKMGGLDVILALIMLGSTLGFLFHNFPPAKIFMGDTGSLFLGFMISVISLLGFKTATLTSLFVPIIILAIPIFDTFSAVIRRTIKGESVGKADKDHFHHQFLKMKFSVKSTVLLIYFINILFAAVSILYVLEDEELAITLYILLLILLLFIILKTDILYPHKKNKKISN